MAAGQLCDTLCACFMQANHNNLCLALCKLRAALLIYELNRSSDEMSTPARIPQFLIEITHEVI